MQSIVDVPVTVHVHNSIQYQYFKNTCTVQVQYQQRRSVFYFKIMSSTRAFMKKVFKVYLIYRSLKHLFFYCIPQRRFFHGTREVTGLCDQNILIPKLLFKTCRSIVAVSLNGKIKQLSLACSFLNFTNCTSRTTKSFDIDAPYFGVSPRYVHTSVQQSYYVLLKKMKYHCPQLYYMAIQAGVDTS